MVKGNKCVVIIHFLQMPEQTHLCFKKRSLKLSGLGWGLGRMDTCLCVTEPLCCTPETVTTLLISYTPMQNKKFKKNFQACRMKSNAWVVEVLSWPKGLFWLVAWCYGKI